MTRDSNIIRLHHIVEVPVRTLDNIARDQGVESQVRELPDIRPTRHIRIPSWREELRDDSREVVDEIREHPISHALVGIATFIVTLLILVAPLWLGWVG